MVVAAFVLLAGASTAAAHSVLLRTTPASGSQVPSAPDSVVLTFNEMPRGRFSAIHVVGPDGKRHDSGPVRVVNDTVTELLGGSRPAGGYVVDWRVISADGHPVSGQFSFRALAAAAPLAPVQSASATASSGGKSSGSTGTIVLVVSLVAVFAIGLAAFSWQRRTAARGRASSAHDEDSD